ncbi:hypothetical protein BH18THE1_BH18THE1_20460 [soil metagenome]
MYGLQMNKYSHSEDDDESFTVYPILLSSNIDSHKESEFHKNKKTKTK